MKCEKHCSKLCMSEKAPQTEGSAPQSRVQLYINILRTRGCLLRTAKFRFWPKKTSQGPRKLLMFNNLCIMEMVLSSPHPIRLCRSWSDCIPPYHWVSLSIAQHHFVSFWFTFYVFVSFCVALWIPGCWPVSTTGLLLHSVILKRVNHSVSSMSRDDFWFSPSSCHNNHSLQQRTTVLTWTPHLCFISCFSVKWEWKTGTLQLLVVGARLSGVCHPAGTMCVLTFAFSQRTFCFLLLRQFILSSKSSEQEMRSVPAFILGSLYTGVLLIGSSLKTDCPNHWAHSVTRNVVNH